MKNTNKRPNYGINSFDLLSSLFSIVNDNRKSNTTNKTIAEYLILNLNNLQNLTIYDVAEECYVSRSSIHRFLKQIGVNQFSSICNYVDDSKLHYKAYYEYHDYPNFEVNSKSLINEMLDDLLNSTNTNSITDLAKVIHDHKRVIILSAATSSFAPKNLQEELVAIDKFIYVYTSEKIEEDSLSDLEESDLLIISSVTGNYAYSIEKHLHQIKAKKILITINHSNRLKKHFDTIFYIGSLKYLNEDITNGNRNVYTKYGLLYYFDMLYHHYVLNYSSKHNN